MKNTTKSKRDRSVRTPTRTPNARSLQNLRPPWKPGVSPNPGGRPPTKPVTDAFMKLFFEKRPEDTLGRTYGEFYVLALFLKAIKGDLAAAIVIADRLEGKTVQPVALTSTPGEPLKFNLNVHFRRSKK
jgi:hypothetical protein